MVAQKAREAAEQARLFARLKTLVEELSEADRKTQFIGLFLRDQKWDVSHFLADEILGVCRSALARWGSDVPRAKNSLLEACRTFESINANCQASAIRQLTEDEWQQTMMAQGRARELIGEVLGEARKAEERSPIRND